jgi:hypothetical protein
LCLALTTESVVAKRNPLLFEIAIANSQKACHDDKAFFQEISHQLTSLKKYDLLEKICSKVSH